MSSNNFTKEKKNKKNKEKKNKEFEKHEEVSSISIKDISPSLILDKVVEIKQKKIKVLTAGASFGELALMEKKPRAATIKCDTECHFAVLEKDHFNDILSLFSVFLIKNFNFTLKIRGKRGKKSISTDRISLCLKAFFLLVILFSEEALPGNGTDRIPEEQTSLSRKRPR